MRVRVRACVPVRVHVLRPARAPAAARARAPAPARTRSIARLDLFFSFAGSVHRRCVAGVRVLVENLVFETASFLYPLYSRNGKFPWVGLFVP